MAANLRNYQQYPNENEFIGNVNEAYEAPYQGAVQTTYRDSIALDVHRSSRQNDKRETVVVMGTGDLGRALVACLIRAGYKAVVASRTPEKMRSKIESIGGETDALPASLAQSDIILLAIPYEAFRSLPSNLLQNKILVDVSNRPSNYISNGDSLAEELQSLLPRSRVVKAFNTLSAYALQKGITQGSKEVPVCSDDDQAKTQVMSLARNLGFTPVDFGSLSNAKAVEDIPLEFFKEWKFPVILTFVIWVFAFVILLFRSHLCPNFYRLSNNEAWSWSSFAELPLDTFQVSLGFTAITILSACYFPGVLAAYLQLYRQTKYTEFPNWLDVWLKGRKQLGLIVLLLVVPHFILAMTDYLGGHGLEGAWKESLFFACGAIAFTMLLILGVTSLPSVAAMLTWKEFSFVQRYLGWMSLFFSLWHLIFINWEKLVENNFKCIFVPGDAQIFIIFPLTTVLLKLPLLLPWVDSRLQKIRRGYEGPKARN